MEILENYEDMDSLLDEIEKLIPEVPDVNDKEWIVNDLLEIKEIAENWLQENYGKYLEELEKERKQENFEFEKERL